MMAYMRLVLALCNDVIIQEILQNVWVRGQSTLTIVTLAILVFSHHARKRRASRGRSRLYPHMLVCFDLIFKLSRYADIIYKLDKKKKEGE